jgi:ATP diphosphatase
MANPAKTPTKPSDGQTGDQSSDRSLPRSGEPFRDLVALMARLRTPGTGCPWDVEQTFETIAPYTIEEAYEVADAIQRRDMGDLKGELGDLLFQSVFHARMAGKPAPSTSTELSTAWSTR